MLEVSIVVVDPPLLFGVGEGCSLVVRERLGALFLEESVSPMLSDVGVPEASVVTLVSESRLPRRDLARP